MVFGFGLAQCSSTVEGHHDCAPLRHCALSVNPLWHTEHCSFTLISTWLLFQQWTHGIHPLIYLFNAFSKAITIYFSCPPFYIAFFLDLLYEQLGRGQRSGMKLEQILHVCAHLGTTQCYCLSQTHIFYQSAPNREHLLAKKQAMCPGSELMSQLQEVPVWGEWGREEGGWVF